eukprot:10952215-Lingulodinium_polyedra.AAC.1
MICRIRHPNERILMLVDAGSALQMPQSWLEILGMQVIVVVALVRNKHAIARGDGLTNELQRVLAP